MRDTFLSDDCGRKRRSPSSSFELSVKSAATFIKWRHSSCLLWSSSSTLAFQEESNDGPSYTQPRDMLAAVVFSPAVPTDTFTFLHGQRRLHFCLAFLFNILNCLFRLLSCFHYSFIHCVKGKQTGRIIIMMSTTKKKKKQTNDKTQSLTRFAPDCVSSSVSHDNDDDDIYSLIICVRVYTWKSRAEREEEEEGPCPFKSSNVR